MAETRSLVSLQEALETLVGRGTLTPAQRDAILTEMDQPQPGPALPEPGPARRRRTLSEVLIEVGLYVGSALVLAAAVVLVAQSWDDLSSTSQIAIMATAALVTGVVGSILSRGAALGGARRRLAGVVLVGTAFTAAATVSLVVGESGPAGTLAFATALAVMVAAQVVASSAITEIGMFVAAFGLLQVTGEWFRPEGVATIDEFGNEVYSMTTFDRLMSLGAVAFGLVWAGVVARWLIHRELAVALGMGVAFVSAMPLAGEPGARWYGLAALAVIAAVGFWRFMVEGYWPWLAAAIASVTAFVFWAVGGGRSPALAFLVAGLVLLGSSALGWQVARRRRTALTR
jgi:hypothetical protein